jgi:cytochrome c biogenesis protein CcdA
MLNLAALILIFITGTVLMLASVFNWSVFFNNSKAGFFTEKFGKNGDRIVYFIIGVLIIVMGVYAYQTGFLNEDA